MLPRAMVETLGYTQYEYTCRMVSLEVHSSLAAVGEKRHSSDAKLKSSSLVFFPFLEQNQNSLFVTLTIIKRMSLTFCLGFLAVILRHLADAGVSVNVASGFYHDHVFVQDGEEELVMELLKELSQSVTESSEEEEVGVRKEKKLKACEKSQDLDSKKESSDYEKETEEISNNHDVVVVCSDSDYDHDD